MDYSNYPGDWLAISKRIRERADWRCEGSSAYPDCRAKNGMPNPRTGSKVVLTVAHLDHDTTNSDETNLRAWCQLCHNTYDMPYRVFNRMKRKRREQMAAGQLDMFMEVNGD